MQIEIKEILINEPAVPQAQSMKEFQAWLDHKKVGIELVREGKRTDDDEEDDEAGKEETAIIEAIMRGDLVINPETMEMTYKLRHPIMDDSGSVAYKEFKLKPRITAAQVQEATKGVTKKEPFKIYIGYISALSGEIRGVINKIDSVDFSLLQKIVGYFL